MSKEPKVRVVAHVPVSLRDWYEAQALKEERSMSGMTAKALKDYADTVKKQEESDAT